MASEARRPGLRREGGRGQAPTPAGGPVVFPGRSPSYGPPRTKSKYPFSNSFMKMLSVGCSCQATQCLASVAQPKTGVIPRQHRRDDWVAV